MEVALGDAGGPDLFSLSNPPTPPSPAQIFSCIEAFLGVRDRSPRIFFQHPSYKERSVMKLAIAKRSWTFKGGVPLPGHVKNDSNGIVAMAADLATSSRVAQGGRLILFACYTDTAQDLLTKMFMQDGSC